MNEDKRMSIEEYAAAKMARVEEVLNGIKMTQDERMEIQNAMESFAELAMHNYAIMAVQEDFLVSIGQSSKCLGFLREHLPAEKRGMMDVFSRRGK